VSTAKEYADGNICFESEELSQMDHLNEYVMTSLRCKEGIDLEYIADRFGKQHSDRLLNDAKGWMDRGVLCCNGSRLYIPTSEFMLSDAVIESLFV
jgi:oxygen-independent coproporphyrinogen-3 oxidase